MVAYTIKTFDFNQWKGGIPSKGRGLCFAEAASDHHHQNLVDKMSSLLCPSGFKKTDEYDDINGSYTCTVP